MGRLSTFPILLNECRTIDISNLKRWGCIKPGVRVSNTINWNYNGHREASISFTVDMQAESPHLKLTYLSCGRLISYKVMLIAVPANIGKGIVWFFICPKTGKRCRKLYLINSFFLHRSAFTGCLYEKQTYSHKIRNKFKYHEKVFGVEEIYDQLDSKYFKTQYAGRPTRRYLQLMKKINAYEKNK